MYFAGCLHILQAFSKWMLLVSETPRSSSKAPKKSGPVRIRGPVLTGFDIRNYEKDFKRSTGDFLRRLSTNQR